MQGKRWLLYTVGTYFSAYVILSSLGNYKSFRNFMPEDYWLPHGYQSNSGALLYETFFRGPFLLDQHWVHPKIPLYSTWGLLPSSQVN